MIRLYKTNGTIEDLELRYYSFEDHRKFVEGHIAGHLLSRSPYVRIIINDDGIRLKLPLNNVFKLYLISKGLGNYPHPIVGNVILFESEEEALIFDGQVDPITKEYIPEEDEEIPDRRFESSSHE